MTDQPKMPSYLMDWSSGNLHRPKQELKSSTENEVTVTFCGDWGPVGEHAAALRSDPTKFYGDIPGSIAGSDLTVVNIEFPIRANGEPLIKDGPTFAVEPDLLKTLPSLGCTVGCLANNHMMDFGEQGLLGTRSSLQQLNIQTIGAGSNLEEARVPLTCEIHGLKLALVNVAEGEEAKATPSRAGVAPFDIAFTCNQISNISKTVDFVLVISHAGRENMPVPPPYIQSAYRAIAEAGAHLIVAHHPHVSQGLEVWNDVPIFYSLGNFALLNRKKSATFRNLGYLIQAKITMSGIDSIQILPYKIEASGLELLKGEARSVFLQNLSTISSHLTPTSLATIWDAYADLWFRAKFSGEIRQFLHLMSWRTLCEGFADRLQGQAKQTKGIVKIILKLLASGFRNVPVRLSNENNLAVRPAAILQNRFDTLAHRELYQTLLPRLIDGRIGTSATWAQELLTAWRSLD